MYINSRPKTETETIITIRVAGPADAEGLRRLTERDSATLPAGRLLVAVSGGEIRAAISPAGEVIADPFHPSVETVGLLRARLDQLRGGERRGLLARLSGLARRRPPRGFSPQPAGTLRSLE
jgi:hypothetical protein